MRNRMLILLVLAGFGLAGWQHKTRILGLINPATTAAHPAEKPDVLYSWVDRDGVTHYQQDSGKGTRIEFDGSRITPLEPVSPEVLEKASAKADAEKPKGSQALHELRNELQRDQLQGRGGSGDL